MTIRKGLFSHIKNEQQAEACCSFFTGLGFGSAAAGLMTGKGLAGITRAFVYLNVNVEMPQRICYNE